MSKRSYSEVHIDEDCRNLKGRFVNALFFNCRFKNLNGLELIDCVMKNSTFETTDPHDALGFAATLNCHSFADLELTPELFDLLCLMLCKTRGNEDKRRAIISEVVGKERAVALLRQLQHLE